MSRATIKLNFTTILLYKSCHVTEQLLCGLSTSFDTTQPPSHPYLHTCTKQQHSTAKFIYVRAAEPWGPQFLTFARRHFAWIIGCSQPLTPAPPNHISVPLPLYLYVHTVAHPCDILPLTQVHPKMLCIYTSLVDLTETWHIWLKGTQSNKVVCMKHHFYPTQTVTFLFSAIPILLPQKQKSFHSGSYPLVTMETRTSFYPPFRLLPTCYHRNKNIIPILHSGSYPLVTIETRTSFLSSIRAVVYLLPQKQDHSYSNWTMQRNMQQSMFQSSFQ